jgi:hypothetical protein
MFTRTTAKNESVKLIYKVQRFEKDYMMTVGIPVRAQLCVGHLPQYSVCVYSSSESSLNAANFTL